MWFSIIVRAVHRRSRRAGIYGLLGLLLALSAPSRAVPLPPAAIPPAPAPGSTHGVAGPGAETWKAGILGTWKAATRIRLPGFQIASSPTRAGSRRRRGVARG